MRVAVYTICKNEEKFVDQWLKMSEDADIRVVGDTGSTDKTLDLLQPALHPRLHVHHLSVQPFRFDVARNALLSLVPANVDVCVVCDMDEVLSPGWRSVLERVWKPPINRLWVNYAAPGLDPYYHNCRIHSRSGWVWRDPCHEGIYEYGCVPHEAKTSSIVIDASGQDKTKSRAQYLKLLAIGINEEPWNSRRIYYYARELMVYQHFEKAIGWFNKYLELWHGDPNREEDKEVQQVRMYIQLCRGALTELATGIKEQTPMVRI